MDIVKKSRISRFVSVLLFLAGWYAAVCAGVFFVQKDLIFFPLRATTAFPKGDGYFSETYYGADGQTVSAFGKDTGAPYVILFFHGNGGNLGRTFRFLSTFESVGADFYAIDYRGYGMSSGHIKSENDFYSDALSAYDRLVARGVPPEKIVVWGRSLWGAAATKVAASRKIAWLVVESTFASMDEMADERFPYLPTRLLNRFHLRSVDEAPKVTAPTLVIHSKDDEVVPIAQSKELYGAFASSKAFLEITGSHNDGHFQNDGRIVAVVTAFLKDKAKQRMQ